MLESVKQAKVAGIRSLSASTVHGGPASMEANRAYKAKVESPAVGSLTEAIMALGAPIDLEKIAAVRAQIARGDYRVDPEALAQKMLDDGDSKA